MMGHVTGHVDTNVQGDRDVEENSGISHCSCLHIIISYFVGCIVRTIIYL